MRRRRVLSIAATVAAAALLSPTAAAAAGPSPSSGAGWQPYRSTPFEDPAGTVCSFGVSATPVRDEEEYRTLASYPDGSPRLQEFRGPLFFRYTNESTGESVVRDLSGRGWFRYGQDGGLRALILDHIGVTVHTGNVGFPAGEWVVNGKSQVTITPDGNRTIKLMDATAENLCDTLA